MDGMDEMKALARDCLGHALAGRTARAAADVRRLQHLQDETARRVLRELLRRGASEDQRRAASAALNESVLLGALGECALDIAPARGPKAEALRAATLPCLDALAGARTTRVRRAAELDAAIAQARADDPQMLHLAAVLERVAELARALGGAPALERAA